MTKRKKLGLVLLLAPIFLIIVVIVGYVVLVNYNLNSRAGIGPVDPTGLAKESTSMITYKIGMVVLGLLSWLAAIGLVIFGPYGIYLLARKEDEEILSKAQGKPEYQNLTSEQLLYIKNWSWGGFLGSGLWALGNKLYLYAIPFILAIIIDVIRIFVAPDKFSGLGSFIGVINPLLLVLVVGISFDLAFMGRDLAWKKGWTDFSAFKKRQKLMAIAVIIFFLVYIAQSFYFVSRPITLNSNNKPNSSGQITEADMQYERALQGFVDTLRARGINPDVNNDGIFNKLDADIMDNPLSDIDGDGLTREQEMSYRTDPFKADSDGDGYSDKQEIDSGNDPLVKASLGPDFRILNYTSTLYHISIKYPEDWNGIIASEKDNGRLVNFKSDVLDAIFMVAFDPFNPGLGDRGANWDDMVMKIKNQTNFDQYCLGKNNCLNKTSIWGDKYIKIFEEVCQHGGGCTTAINYYFYNPQNKYTTIMLSNYALQSRVGDSEKYLDYMAENFQFVNPTVK